MRPCRGCGQAVPPSLGRKPRTWCSEVCRVRTYIAENPEYKSRVATLAAQRHRETFTPAAHEKSCAVCASKFTAGRSNRKYCSTPCRYRAAYVGRRGRRAGAERERYLPIEIADRDEWRCGICSEDVDASLTYPHPQSLSIDHVIPLALGGADIATNVQPAHLACNWRKGASAA